MHTDMDGDKQGGLSSSPPGGDPRPPPGGQLVAVMESWQKPIIN